MNLSNISAVKVLTLVVSAAIAGQVCAAESIVNYESANAISKQPEGSVRFIVKYKDGTPSSQGLKTRSTTKVMASGMQVAGFEAQFVRTTGLGAGIFAVPELKTTKEAHLVMDTIASNPDVEFVEVDRLAYPKAAPNDPSYRQQWHYFGNYGVKANKVWDRGFTGQGVVVSVVDTGILDHVDLNGNMLPGYDFISSAPNARDGDQRDNNPADEGDWFDNWDCGGYPDPRREKKFSTWHGSHVAGTIAAVTNNGVGVAGVAYGAKVIPVRVLGKCGGYDSDITDGMYWSAGGHIDGVPDNQNPAQVVNMSLGGGGGCSQNSQRMIDKTTNLGALIVIAAGNENQDASRTWPSSCNNVLSVGATTPKGKRAPFSNYGARVHLAAPGTNILSTIDVGQAGPVRSSYGMKAGTSMAAPHVSGVAALVISAANSIGKTLTPSELSDILVRTTSRFNGRLDRGLGSGIVDANAAVNAVLGDQNRAQPRPPVNQPINSGNKVYRSDRRVAIRDLRSVTSGIRVNDQARVGSANITLTLDIRYGDRSQLAVELIAPSGRVYPIYHDGKRQPNIVGPATFSVKNERLQGTWTLKVTDKARGVTGSIDSWSLTF
uniref:Extracellular basic protease n=1 Tax=Dichelobacter nodosus TaxID=870 RepID=BPRV_DICNO|nr:RecName: Full=Extracellular basic protease; Flags: Precursor [Dichelobacter nodosus]CAA78894.1 basic protease [Dichelobacter nodosus]